MDSSSAASWCPDSQACHSKRPSLQEATDAADSQACPRSSGSSNRVAASAFFGEDFSLGLLDSCSGQGLSCSVIPGAAYGQTGCTIGSERRQGSPSGCWEALGCSCFHGCGCAANAACAAVSTAGFEDSCAYSSIAEIGADP